MDIGRHLEQYPDTLSGVVRVRGTRLSVDFIFGLYENGWTEKQVPENYPQLIPEAVVGIFAFARQALHSEQIIFPASWPACGYCATRVPLAVERAMIDAGHDSVLGIVGSGCMRETFHALSN